MDYEYLTSFWQRLSRALSKQEFASELKEYIQDSRMTSGRFIKVELCTAVAFLKSCFAIPQTV
jgi:hypothetical protein